MRFQIISFIAMICIVSSAHAQMRIWTDQSGQQYEAEYMKDLFGKITLRTVDGKEIRVPLEDLSEADQKYLRVEIPPTLDVTCRIPPPKRPARRGDWDDRDDTETWVYNAEVTISKESRRPFTSRLFGELFLIAEEVDGDNYILLSKTEASFLLLDKDNNQHAFKAEPVEVRRFLESGGKQWRGEEFYGYLVVISDRHGTILAVKTDIKKPWVSKPETIAALRELATRGALSLRSRHFDETGHKVKAPRPEFHLPSEG